MDNDLTLLSGNIFAYVYLKLPLMKKKWMGKFTIFDWDGISMDKNLLSSALVLKKDKTMAFGDVDNSDQALMNRIANGDSDFSIQAIIENKIGEFSVYENENEKIAGTNKRLAGYIR